jgi:arginine decarboxylase
LHFRGTQPLATLSRLPIEYFRTSGTGQCNYGSIETCSWDAALREAKIADANMMYYSSLVPKEATEVSRSKGREDLRWGNVLESILAVTHAKKGQRCTAALMLTKIFAPDGEYLGIFADEYTSTSGNLEDGKQNLLESVTGMMERRGYGHPNRTALKAVKNAGPNLVDTRATIETSKGYRYQIHAYFGESFKVTKKFGSALAGICFTKFLFPVLK